MVWTLQTGNEESTLENTGQITDDAETLYTLASQWMLSNVRTFSPTKVNEARFGYNSMFNNITPATGEQRKREPGTWHTYRTQ